MEEGNHIEFIESFLDGDIGREELMKLGGFASNEDLDRAIELYREGVEEIYDLGLSNNLKEIHQKLYGTKERQLSPRKILLAAASVILLGLFTFLLVRKNDQPDFDSYFQPYPNYRLSRSINGQRLNEALTLYSLQEFDSAQMAFESIEMDTVNFDYSLYFGITYLANHDFKKASEVLIPAISAGNANPYYQQTRWYLALAYWKNKDVINAISLLEEIEEGQYKFAEAQELIELLR